MLPGHWTRLAIGGELPATHGFELEATTLSRRTAISTSVGATSSRALPDSRAAGGAEQIEGTLELLPNSGELRRLLPWVLGAEPVGNLFLLAERLPERFVVLDKVNGLYTYHHCLVARAEFHAAVNKLMRLKLHLVALDETTAPPDTLPTLQYLPGLPLTFANSSLTIDDEPIEVSAWQLTIDHGLRPWHGSSLSPARYDPSQRRVTLAYQTPLRDDSLTWHQPPSLSRSARLKVEASLATLCFDLASLRFTADAPLIQVPHDMTQTLLGHAHRLATTDELTITLD